MFDLVHIRIGTFVFPGACTGNPDSPLDESGPFRPHDEQIVFVMASHNLSLGQKPTGSIGPFIIDFNMVKNVTPVCRDLSTTDGGTADGRNILHRPLQPVNGVNGLFDQAIA